MNLAQHILIFGIRLYRWTISPLLATLAGPMGRCRFTPTCSQYALDSVRVHGALKGSLLAGWRICRCNPWGGCGHDPVPLGNSSHAAHNLTDGSAGCALVGPVGKFSEGRF